MLNKRRRWVHSSRVKLALVSMSASWFLVSTYLIWIFGSKLILSNNQRNSVSSGHVSHRWTSSFDDHFDDSFVVFKKCGTEIHLEKNVCQWVRNPHLTIAQPLALSFQLVFWSFFLRWNGLLGQVYLVLQCCLLNV